MNTTRESHHDLSLVGCGGFSWAKEMSCCSEVTTVFCGEVSSKMTEIKRKKDGYLWNRQSIRKVDFEDRGAYLETGSIHRG